MQKEIQWLLKEKYGWDNAELLLNKRVLSPKEIVDINRIKKGEPVAYVIGKTEFLECQIDLSLKPLIPRPETEYWVGNVLRVRPFLGSDPKTGSQTKILDLCCGSGCIGIAILKHFPNALVDFVDIESNALKQTEINLELNQISTRNDPRSSRDDPSASWRMGSSLIRSDLFSSLKGKRYDYIFCNPPYVDPNGEFDKSLKFEPKEALFAKDNGMFFIKKILKEFTNYIKPNGILFLEFGSEQKDQIERELKLLKRPKRLKTTFHKDQFNRWRFLKATL